MELLQDVVCIRNSTIKGRTLIMQEIERIIRVIPLGEKEIDDLLEYSL